MSACLWQHVNTWGLNICEKVEVSSSILRWRWSFCINKWHIYVTVSFGFSWDTFPGSFHRTLLPAIAELTSKEERRIGLRRFKPDKSWQKFAAGSYIFPVWVELRHSSFLQRLQRTNAVLAVRKTKSLPCASAHADSCSKRSVTNRP